MTNIEERAAVAYSKGYNKGRAFDLYQTLTYSGLRDDEPQDVLDAYQDGFKAGIRDGRADRRNRR